MPRGSARPGQTGADDFLRRRRQPARHVGLQARVDQARRPAAARAGEAGYVSRAVGQSDAQPLFVSPARSLWQVGFGLVAAPGGAGRSNVLYSLAGGGKQHARSGRVPDEYRPHDRGLPECRGVGQLCTGERERGPAGLCGDPRSAGDFARGSGQLVQRVPAGRVSGDDAGGPRRHRAPGAAGINFVSRRPRRPGCGAIF